MHGVPGADHLVGDLLLNALALCLIVDVDELVCILHELRLILCDSANDIGPKADLEVLAAERIN